MAQIPELVQLDAVEIEAVQGADQPPPVDLTNMILQMSLDRNIEDPPLPTLVAQKTLSATDLSTHHCRLLFPIPRIGGNFLTALERQHLLHGIKPMNYLRVKIMDVAAPMLYENAKLSLWNMGGPNYAIRGRWNAFVRRNNLAVGMVIQLWFFRLQGERCFALVQLP